MANTRELWEQLDNESPRKFEGFKAFRGLPPKDRNLINAWRIYSQNASAPKVPPSFKRWHDEYAWADRARAYDIHVERVRQRGVEKAIEDEARAQQQTAEKVHGQMHELLTSGYENAMRWMEERDWQGWRPQDVVAIIKLHVEAADKFPVDKPTGEAGDDWTEEDDREFMELVAEVFSERQAEAKEEREIEEEAEAERSDEDEEHPKESEDG